MSTDAPRRAREAPAVRARKSAAERAAEIAAAARAIALDEGLHALTLRAVADRVGVTAPLVAHYRPSMDALVAETFRAIVADELAEVGAHVRARLERDRLAGLRTLLLTLLDGGRDDVTAVWVDGWSLSRRNALLADAVRAQTAAWHDLLASLLLSAADREVLSTTDADRVAAQLLAMVDGLNTHALIGISPGPANVALIARALEHELRLPAGALSG